MIAPSLRHPAGKFLLRHYVELLAAFAVLFVLQTGLLPFDFTTKPVQGAAGELFGAATSRYTFPDVISNIFLYIPVGILVHWSLSRALRCSGAALLLTIGFAVALSGAIEWLQAYSPTRMSSIIDLVSNVLGASLGLVLSLTVRWFVPRILGAALIELHQQPQCTLAKAYCGALVFAAAMPFSISFDAGLLARSLKSANCVPFAAVAAYEREAEKALEDGNHYQYSFARWQSMKHWSRWTAEVVSFIVLVWLLHPILCGLYGFSRHGAVALIWWICGGLAIGLSLMQLFVVTRGFDVTDILFRWLGVAGGLIFRSLYDQPADDRQRNTRDPRRQRLATLGCAATVAYIVYIGVIPLTFTAGRGLLTPLVTSWELLPFFGYFATRFDLMMDDVMEKFGAYALFAALFVTCWTRAGTLPTWSRVGILVVVGAAIAFPLEMMQAYLPVRVASVTDLILAGGGCAVGVLAQEHAVRFYHFALSHMPSAHADLSRSVSPTGDLSPTDLLVGSLVDPDADAPVEPSPKSRPTPLG